MHLKHTIFLLTFVINLVFSLPACKKVDYNFYVLALTWPNEYCSQNKCDINWRSQWDSKSMIIHGFWPSSTDLSYLSCLSENDYDPNCYRRFIFSQNSLSADVLKDMRKYWPQLGSVQNFWSYEWRKHGTCYLSIIKDEYQSKLSDAEIFEKYFAGVVNKTRILNITLQRGAKFNSKIQLASKIGLHSSQFYAICGSDNELDEIRVCFDVYKVPGNQYLTTCPYSSDRNQCKFPIVVS